MLDIKTITIDKFFRGLNVLRNSDKNIFPLFSQDITPYHKEVIKTSITLRNLVNNSEERDTINIEKYIRQNQSQIDVKALASEYMFSMGLQRIMRNKRVKNIKVITPPIAEAILNHTKQDYVMSDDSEEVGFTFDVKGQFETNKYNYLCVNIEAFNRMKTQSDFFVAALIDGKQDDFNTNSKITYYFIKMSYYEKMAEKILTSSSKNFTPYLRLNLLHFKTKEVNKYLH